MNRLKVSEDAMRVMRLNCSSEAQALSSRMAIDGTLVPLKLCYIPSQKGVYGALKFVPINKNIPNGFIDSGSRLGISIPYANYFGWLVDHSSKLPVLAF